MTNEEISVIQALRNEVMQLRQQVSYLTIQAEAFLTIKAIASIFPTSQQGGYSHPDPVQQADRILNEAMRKAEQEKIREHMTSPNVAAGIITPESRSILDIPGMADVVKLDTTPEPNAIGPDGMPHFLDHTGDPV